MRLSLELPGLLLAGDRNSLGPVRQAAKLLNINTTLVNTTEEALATDETDHSELREAQRGDKVLIS